MLYQTLALVFYPKSKHLKLSFKNLFSNFCYLCFDIMNKHLYWCLIYYLKMQTSTNKWKKTSRNSCYFKDNGPDQEGKMQSNYSDQSYQLTTVQYLPKILTVKISSIARSASIILGFCFRLSKPMKTSKRWTQEKEAIPQSHLNHIFTI